MVATPPRFKLNSYFGVPEPRIELGTAPYSSETRYLRATSPLATHKKDKKNLSSYRTLQFLAVGKIKIVVTCHLVELLFGELLAHICHHVSQLVHLFAKYLATYFCTILLMWLWIRNLSSTKNLSVSDPKPIGNFANLVTKQKEIRFRFCK